MTVPSWFESDVYFNNKLAQYGGDALALKVAFEQAGYPVTAEGMFSHFVQYGNAENVSPNSWFNASQYLYSKAADFYNTGNVTTSQVTSMALAMKGAGMTAWDHYNQYWVESYDAATESFAINPSVNFDVTAYMKAKLAQMQHTDASYTMQQLVNAFDKAGLSPVEHFSMYGKGEGLSATPVSTGTPGATFTLGFDDLFGTNGDDYISDRAGVLSTTSYIDGGDGNDTLYSFVNFADGAVKAPEIVRVENVLFRVQAEATSSDGNNNVDGYIDAGDIRDMTLLGSDNSRASLTVEDVRINSNEMTIRFADADPGEVDFNVHFHAQYLKADAASTSGTLYAQLIDTVGALTEAQGGHDNALYDNPFTGFMFTLNGEEHALNFGEYNHKTQEAAPTYADLAAKMQAAINADAALSKLGLIVSTGSPFTAVVSIGEHKGDVVSGTQIVISSAQGELVGGNWVAANGLPATNSTAATFVDEIDSSCPLIRTTVELDNVGQVQWDDASPECLPDDVIYGSNAGDLTIGSGALRGGIERFDVKVDEGSWLSALRSTNNALRMVTVEAKDIDGDHVSGGQLYIGDWTGRGEKLGNTDLDDTAWTDAAQLLTANATGQAAGLIDVAVFDATDYAGDINIAAQVTSASYNKYFSSVDGVKYIDEMYAPLAADEYAGEFSYFTGKGDDVVNMTVNGAIAADVDFKMNINTGAGDDLVAFRYANMTANQSLDQKNLKNVAVNTGDGDDTVWFYGDNVGDGSLVINAGAGNDVIYANQQELFTGGAIPPKTPADYNAVFVFNTTETVVNVGSLAGATLGNDMAIGKDVFTVVPVAGETLAVSVTFKGYEANVKIGTVTTDLTSVTAEQINHAIIDAIENDPVLSSLISAKDGAGHSLLIESIINGKMDASDLSIEFYAVKADGTVGGGTTIATGEWYDTQFGKTTGGTPYAGNDTVESQVVVDAGAGDDIVVIGPNGTLKDVVSLSANFGNDAIVGFVSGQDKVNLAGLLDASKALNTTGAASALTNNAVAILADNAKAENGIFTQTEVTKLATDGKIKMTGGTAGDKAVVFLHDTNEDGQNVYTAVQVNSTGATVLGSLTLDARHAVMTSLSLADFTLSSELQSSYLGNTYGKADYLLASSPLEGTIFNDTFNDLANDNVGALTDIKGLAGNDVFNTVADFSALTLDGGEGNDTFNISGFSEIVTGGKIIGGAGVDTVKIDASADHNVTLTSVSSVESIVVTHKATSPSGVVTINLGATDGVTLTGMNAADKLSIDAAGEDVTINGMTVFHETFGTTDQFMVTNVDDLTVKGLTFDSTIAAYSFSGTSGIAGKVYFDGSSALGTQALTLAASAHDSTLIGGAGNDKLTGGDGVDTLIGGAGNDELEGGLGDDILTGGDGENTFKLDTVTNAGKDTITDFTAGAGGDKIDFGAITAIEDRLSVSSAGYATLENFLTNGDFTGSNTLAANTAYLVSFAGEQYLMLDGGIAGYDASDDAVVKLVGTYAADDFVVANFV